MRIALLFLLIGLNAFAQEIDSDLKRIMLRLDSIKSYSAQVELRTDISFINMPTKYARVRYRKNAPLEVRSDDFVLLPKRGMDLSMQALFAYPFITVDRGTKVVAGTQTKMLNIIPTDDTADFSIATLYLDVPRDRLVGAEISTKKEGTYTVLMAYASKGDVLPREAEVVFAVERLRIPLNFMGKDTRIDRKALREEGAKEGRIFLTLSDYDIVRE